MNAESGGKGLWLRRLVGKARVLPAGICARGCGGAQVAREGHLVTDYQSYVYGVHEEKSPNDAAIEWGLQQ